MKSSWDTVIKLLHVICAQLENRAEIVCIPLSVGEQKEEWCGIVYTTGWCRINKLPKKQANSQGRFKPNQTDQNTKPKDAEGSMNNNFFFSEEIKISYPALPREDFQRKTMSNYSRYFD